GNAILEFRRVLRMDLRAIFDGAPDSLLRRHGREFIRVRPVPGVAPEQDALAGRIEVGAGVGNLADRQIGIADAAENEIVLFPEAPLELQADTDGRAMGHRADRRLHETSDIDLDLAEDAERNGAHAPVCAVLADGTR